MLAIEKEFLQFIQNPEFPCMGAKAAAKKGLVSFVCLPDFNAVKTDVVILNKVYDFIKQWQKKKESLHTLAIIFENPTDLTEIEFEKNLWQHLQNLHNLDSQLYNWDSAISADINAPEFSFSLGNHGFFVLGLHPNSSRKARQFSHPTLVFNLHEQFEKIREEGVFARMRDKIREQDIKFSGSINPMVEDFGKSSEALQYSGRQVNKNHRCPFILHSNQHNEWCEIPPCSGTSFVLSKNSLLIIEDIYGEQVADLFCFSQHDKDEFLSSGKSIDYNETFSFSINHILYSNRSNPMLTIIHDDVKKHDFLYAPCCKELFRKSYGKENPSKGCYENLVESFEKYKIDKNYISTTFNIFMNVSCDAAGKLEVLAPLSKNGDKIIFKSHMDLIVGLTACSAELSNNFSFKPIKYMIKQT